MAYGTESIAPVDKIFGPGGGAVNTQTIGECDVAIDLPAGPSEVVVAADLGYDEVIIQQELDAQMEHGPDSRAFVVRVGDDLEAALAEIEATRPTRRAAGRTRGVLAGRIRNAGAVFGTLFAGASRDYATGATTFCRLVVGQDHRGLGLEGFMKTVPSARHERRTRTARANDRGVGRLEDMPAHKRRRDDEHSTALDAYQWPPRTNASRPSRHRRAPDHPL